MSRYKKHAVRRVRQKITVLQKMNRLANMHVIFLMSLTKNYTDSFELR